MDVYVADHIHRQSIDASAEKLHTFIESYNLHRYETVHVFAYIMGTWVLNRYLTRPDSLSLTSIIYDRSPYQELAPRLIIELFGLPTRLLGGSVIADLAHSPYQPMKQQNIRVGLMIEQNPTRLIQTFRWYVNLRQWQINWNIEALGQRYDDACFVPLNHDQMYRNFDTFIPQARHFYETGHFIPG